MEIKLSEEEFNLYKSANPAVEIRQLVLGVMLALEAKGLVSEAECKEGFIKAGQLIIDELNLNSKRVEKIRTELQAVKELRAKLKDLKNGK